MARTAVRVARLGRLARIAIGRRLTNRRACQKVSSPMASKDGWSKKFDDVIVTPDRKKLVTLRDAIQYLANTVPKSEQNHEKVTIAAEHLTKAAEGSAAWMFFARAATLQAIYRNEERVFNLTRKEYHWAKRKLKRDE